MPGRINPDIRDSVPLEVAPLPGSTYVRPEVTQPGNDLLRVASTLSSLSPGLADLGQTIMRRQQADDLRKLQATEPLKSDAEALADYKAKGPPADFDPVRQARSVLTGQRVAQQLQQDTMTDLGSREVDWRTFNASDYLAQRQKEYAQRLDGDDYALQSYNRSLADFPAKLMTMRTQGALQQLKQTGQDNSFAAMKMAAEKTLSGDGTTDEDGEAGQKATPDAVAASVWTAANAVAGPKGSQGVSFNDANKYAIQIAKGWVADGKNLDAAVALLSNPRPNQDGGPDLPALINTAQSQPEVQAVIKAATAAKAKAAKQAAIQAITDGDTSMMLSPAGPAKLATVGDVSYTDDDGNTKVIKAATRQADAVRGYLTKSAALAAANHETPQQTLDRDMGAFVWHGVDNPQWKATLQSAAQSADLSTLTSDPVKRDSVLKASALYDTLLEKSPTYLRSLVDKPTMQFFDAMRVAKTLPSPSGVGTMSSEEAADAARRATMYPKDDDVMKGKLKEIALKINAATPTSSAFEKIFGITATPANQSRVAGRLTETANLYAGLGFGADDAISKATETVKNSSRTVLGTVVPDNFGKLPGDFEQQVKSYASDFLTRYGANNGGIGLGDVTPVYDGANTYTLTNRNTGAALTTGDRLAHFTLQDLYGHTQAVQDDKRTQVLQKAQQTPRQQQTLSAVKDPTSRQLLQQFYGNGPGGMTQTTYDQDGSVKVTSPPPIAAPGGAPSGASVQKSSFLGALNPVSAAQASVPANGAPPSDRAGPSAADGRITDISGQSTYPRQGEPLDDVKGFIVHHTGSRASPEETVSTLNQRGLGVQFVMDRDGKVYRTLPNGSRGAHIRPSEINDLSNSNTMGMEVIANDDKDVTPAQVQAATRFIGEVQRQHPGMQVFGHGEVNPGHKQATEGMTIVNAIRNGAPPVTAASAAPARPASARTLAAYAGRD